MDRLLIDYLPGFLKEYKELKQIMTAEQPEFELAWDRVDSIIENSFIETQDEETAARWEKVLKLVSKDTDSLEVRNMRILAVTQNKLPHTYRVLDRNLLTLIKNKKDYILTIDYDNYAVDVVVALSSKELLNEVATMLDKVVPANMLIDVQLWNTTHLMLERYTHKEMEVYTHEQLTELDLR